MKKITKAKFLSVYNSTKANKFTLFVYRHFAKHDEGENTSMTPIVTISLLSLFMIGFVSTALDLPNQLIAISSILLSVIVFIVVIFIGLAIIMNNMRVKKIQRKLGISNEEYNILFEKYALKTNIVNI